MVFLLLLLCISCSCRSHYIQSTPASIEYRKFNAISDVSGRILLMGYDQPIKHVLIEILDVYNKKTIKRTLSDKRGRFNIKLPPGKYLLRMHLAGFDAIESIITIDPLIKKNMGNIELRPSV